MLTLTRLLELSVLLLLQINSILSGPDDASDDIRHGSTAVGAEDLNGGDGGCLGDTVLEAQLSDRFPHCRLRAVPYLARCDCTRTVSTMTVAVNVLVVLRNSLAPTSTTLEFLVVNEHTSVDNVDIDAFATMCIVLVLGEGAEAQLVAMADTCEALSTNRVSTRATAK